MNDSPSPSSTPPERVVACPGCGRPAVFAPRNRFRPFCSERCRLIDLGEWARETYRVPVAPDDEAPPDFSAEHAE